MARRAQETERPARRRRGGGTKEQTEGVLRAASSAQDAGAAAAGSAQQAGETAAGGAQGAAGTATGQAATAQAATEIAEGAMQATRNVATTALGAAKETLTNGERGGQEGLFRQVFLAAREAAGKVLEREARSAARQAAEVLTARGPEIAREQLQKRGGSNAAARAAVEFGRAKLQGAGGSKALTAAAVGAVKESAGGLRTKVSDAIGGEKAEEAEGGTSRLPVEVSIDIGAPRQVVWDEWTQFENSPESLHRIQETDDGTLKVSSKVWGSTKEEEVEITEQVAEERLAWRADGAIPYRGVVTFHSLGENLTRLLVTLEFEPQGLVARLGAGARSIQRAVEADVKRFKADLETRSDEDEDSDQLQEGDEEEQSEGEEPELDAEVVDAPDDGGDLDEDLPDADVYDDDVDEPQDAAEPEDEDEEPTGAAESEPEEEEEPAPRRRASRGSAASRGTGSGQSRRGSASGGGRGKSTASSPRSSGRTGTSGGQKARSGNSSSGTSGRKTESGSSRAQSRSGGSRQRAASRKS